MESEDRAYHHTEACQMLGVSVATMRRLAKHYEDAFEPLPTDARGGRGYPNQALKRMQAARALFDEGRAANLDTAFKLLARGGEDAEGEILLRANEPEPIHQLLIEFRGMRHDDGGVTSGECRDKGTTEGAHPPSDTQPSEKAVYVAEMDQIHTNEELEEERKRVRELNRRIEYLHQELERRSNEPQQVKRPWWKVWGR